VILISRTAFEKERLCALLEGLNYQIHQKCQLEKLASKTLPCSPATSVLGLEIFRNQVISKRSREIAHG